MMKSLSKYLLFGFLFFLTISFFGCLKAKDVSIQDRILFFSDKGGVSEWYVMNSDGSDIVKLPIPISKGMSLQSLTWQSDLPGFFLTINDENGDSYLYSYIYGDSSIKQLTKDSMQISNIAFSKESGKVVFNCFDYGLDICAMDISGKKIDKLTNFLSNEADPIFVNEGKELIFVSAYSGIQNIWKIDANGENLVNLSNIGYMEINPKLSPDGKSIVFESQRDSHWNIFIMGIDGSNVTDLTNSASTNRFPQWSPDGSKIGFLSNREGEENIFMMNKDGSNLQNLTQGFAGKIQSFIWSGDSKQILFVGLINDYLQIFSVNISTSALNQITHDRSNHTSIAWINSGQ